MPPPLAIADSKVLYQSGGSLVGLEQGVYVALALSGHRPSSWREIWRTVAPDCSAVLDAEPWFAEFDRAWPIASDAASLALVCEALVRRLQEIGMELRAVQACAIFPAQFNALVDQLGNKASLLSRATFELVARQLQSLGEEPVLIQCDKHGGRNRYGPQLQQAFPESLVEGGEESRERSVYRWGPRSRRVEIRFCVRGERFLPCALASMVSKYLRELAMLAFNEFWVRQVPGLKPTAGYPVDAGRFQADIAACQTQLQIPDRLLWRKR
jgi:hypothetical protein